MKVNPLDDDRPGLTRRQLIGLATLTGNSGVAADLHDYHPPTQRVSRGNTQSNACILPPETPCRQGFLSQTVTWNVLPIHDALKELNA